MNPLPVHNYLVVGAILFALGAIGFLTRRNLIIMFLCAEMMLQGVTINLVAFGRRWGNLQGQVFALFIITVAACEAAIALPLILILYRNRHSLDVSLWQDLREADQEPTAGHGTVARFAAGPDLPAVDARRSRASTAAAPGRPAMSERSASLADPRVAVSGQLSDGVSRPGCAAPAKPSGRALLP